MTAGKRASMREGPLAALFRKTAEEAGMSGAPRPEAGMAGAPGSEAHRPGHPEPNGPADSDADETVDSEAQLAGPEAPRDDPVDAPERRLLNAFSPEVRQAAPPPSAPPPSAPPPPSASPARNAPSTTSAPPPPSASPALSASPVPNASSAPSASSLPASAPSGPQPPPAPPTAPGFPGSRLGDRRPLGRPLLRVVGVGGAGGNAINRMVEAEIEGVEFVAINTDVQSLQQSAAHQTLQIGDSITRGLGTGADPELGRQAASSAHDRIKALLRGSDMVFIATGEGGGTGTGAAPVVAEIARELGALTVAIVTRPFQFEGIKRQSQAEEGIGALAEEVDTLIVVPNNRLLTVLDRNTSMVDAFKVADDVLRQGVQGIADLVTLPGLINLDFADVRTIMSNAGTALLGIGIGTGERRAIEAAEQAVASPLLDTSMEGARSILLSITGGRDLSLWEVNESARAVADAAHPDANIIFGAMVDERLTEQVWVTVIATGYGNAHARRRGGLEASRTRGSTGQGLRDRARGLTGWRSAREARPVDELDVPEFIPRR